MKTASFTGLLLMALSVAFSTAGLGQNGGTAAISAAERTEIVAEASSALARLPKAAEAKSKLTPELYDQYKSLKSQLGKLAAGSNLSDKKLNSLLKKVEATAHAIDRLAVRAGGTGSCTGTCRSERIDCQADCRRAGRQVCLCYFSAALCNLCCFAQCPG